jgi:murein DD-endopeptidase MepM/ murein hydrolase activator NlpD
VTEPKGHGRPVGSARIGLGGGFQPVPGAQILRIPDGDGVARIPAHRGTPVHATVAAIVLDVDGRGGLSLRGSDGTCYRYSGLDPATVTVGPGVTVSAGDILGGTDADVLELGLTDAYGEAVDAVDAMLGLIDPNELGYTQVGAGLGVDPDVMDREIVRDGTPGPGAAFR